ncbi:MAG: hypothetical protein EBT79_14090 [Actinobacteria bacterium]|nr:hypothetical protein [Actinomycetota bacterium]
MSGGQSDPGGIVLRRWQSEALPIVIDAIKARKNPVVSAFMGAGKSVFLAALIRQSRDASSPEPCGAFSGIARSGAGMRRRRWGIGV